MVVADTMEVLWRPAIFVTHFAPTQQMMRRISIFIHLCCLSADLGMSEASGYFFSLRFVKSFTDRLVPAVVCVRADRRESY